MFMVINVTSLILLSGGQCQLRGSRERHERRRKVTENENSSVIERNRRKKTSSRLINSLAVSNERLKRYRDRAAMSKHDWKSWRPSNGSVQIITLS